MALRQWMDRLALRNWVDLFGTEALNGFAWHLGIG